MKIYFIQKEGVYGHGIAWIGFAKEEGLEKLKEWASNDEDDYHEWVLYEYLETPKKGLSDLSHLKIESKQK